MHHSLESTKKPCPLTPVLSFHLWSGAFSIVPSFPCHNFPLKCKDRMEEKASTWRLGSKDHTFRNKCPSTEESYILRWRSAVLRLEEHFRTKGGTFNGLVTKSSFPLPCLEFTGPFAYVRNARIGCGDVCRLVGSIHPSSSANLGVELCPIEGGTAESLCCFKDTRPPPDCLLNPAFTLVTSAFGSLQLAEMTFTYFATAFSQRDCKAFVSLALYQLSHTSLLLL